MVNQVDLHRSALDRNLLVFQVPDHYQVDEIGIFAFFDKNWVVVWCDGSDLLSVGRATAQGQHHRWPHYLVLGEIAIF